MPPVGGAGCDQPAARLRDATRLLSRAMRREAALRCRMPLLAALLSSLAALRSSLSAADSSLRSTASRTLRTSDLTRERTTRLRSRRLAFWRLRLIADL